MLVPAPRQRHRPHWIPAFAGMTGLGVVVGWWAGGLVGWWAGGLVGWVGWWAGGLVRQGRGTWLDFSSGADPHCATARRTPPQATPARHSGAGRNPETTPGTATPAGRPHHGHAGSSAPLATPRPHWIPAFAGMTGLSVVRVGGRMRPRVAGLAVFQQRRGPALHSSPQNAAASRPRSSLRHRPESRNHARPATPAGRPHHGRAGSSAPSAAQRPHWIPAFAGMTGLGVGLVGGCGRGRGAWLYFSNGADPHCTAARRTPPQAAPLVIAAQAGIQKPRPAPPPRWPPAPRPCWFPRAFGSSKGRTGYRPSPA